MTAAKKDGTAALREQLATATRASDKGLGYVWEQSTHAVGETFGAVGVLATAGRQLAEKAREAAVYSRIEGSQELCKLLDIEATGIDCLLTSDAIVNYVCSRR